ncbi:hypothetical protein ACFO5O_05620 [Geojedonia litorea]|uniref:Uncharacterized protein n=1 Tax=Geojedonia litorea TaxID=1268269 RepID=A0ABV9N0I3_9FLAO
MLIGIGLIAIQLLFNNLFQSVCNRTIIAINVDRNPNGFINPFLGMKSNLSTDGATFRYDDTFLYYKELTFKKNHGITEKDLKEPDMTDIVKIYNTDWFLIKAD